jgi:hypothetical protein
MQVKMFKMPFKTNHFNKNQKVWVISLSGNLSAHVIGKHRGKNKYIRAWISWDSKTKESPEIKEIEISADFYDRLGLIA